MKQRQWITLNMTPSPRLVAALCFVVGTPVMAATPPEPASIDCHVLMTDSECSAFLSQLATLPRDATLERYLAGHLALMNEREKVCSCNQYKTGKALLFPKVSQWVRPH